MDVKFKDLSGWLQAAVVFVWIMAGVYGLSFIVGFIRAVAQW